ncbi:MAG: hypothetical protein R2844_04155 [Caldilineales bacterium]
MKKLRPEWVLVGLMLLAAALRLWRLNALPPGLFFDEAYNGFDARQLLKGDSWPLFFPGNNGREPLFIYLQALSVAVVGATPFALRLVSALIGIATIPAIYFCSLTLLTPQPATTQQRRLAGWLSLVAAAGLTVSYWHVSLSRLGFRVNLLIPISALAIAFFWRGWMSGRRRDYAWAGFWLALTMYTYIAARLLPFVILAFVAIELGIALLRARSDRNNLRAQWQPRLKGLLVLAAVGLVFSLPLVWTFLSNPSLLSARTGQVSIWTGWQAGAPGQWAGDLMSNVWATARAFYDRGDQNLRHNLPGRPVNDLLLAVLFTLGWLSALLSVTKRPRSLLLLLWFFIMLAPTVLSTEAPQYLRSAGALPPLAIFYALGVSAAGGLWRRIAPRSSRIAANDDVLAAASIVVILLVLAWSGTRTAVDYFQRWASLPGLGAAFDVDKQLAASTAASLLAAPTQGPVVMATDLYLQPQMAFALGKIAATSAPPASTAEVTLLQEDGFDPRGSLMLIAHQDGRLVSAWLAGLSPQDLESATPVDTLRWPAHQTGWPQLTQSVLAAGTPLRSLQVRYPLDVTFANGMRLVGYSIEPEVLMPGQRDARLTLYWQERGPDDGQIAPREGEYRSSFDVFAHLVVDGAVAATDNGQLRTQALADYLHTGQPMIEDVRFLAAPDDPSTGKAHFEVGLYRYHPGSSSGANDRIAIVDQSGQDAADQVELGSVWLGSPPAAADMSDLRALGVQFNQRVELAGAKASVDPSDPRRLAVDLEWKALDRPTSDYVAFVHLIDQTGQIIAQHDAPPGGLQNPTHLWAPGEMVRSSSPLELPEGLNRADLSLRIGLYEPVSQLQLPVTVAGDSVGDASSGSYLVVPLQALQEATAP